MPTSVTAGEAFIKVSAKGVGQATRSIRDLERMLVRGFGNMVRMASRLGVALAAVATGALVDFTRRAMNAQETWQKFSVVFGDRAQYMAQWVQKLAETMGRSKEEMARMAGEAQDLFVPLGFSSDAAERMSKIVTRLSLDLASFNNRKDADAFRDLTAALTGSTETMKKYGSIVTWAAVKQEALNMGIDPTRLSETQKAWFRLKIIIETTRAAQGDLLRTQNSSVNVIKRLGAAYQNAAVQIGNQLLPYLDWFAKMLTHIVNNVGPVFASAMAQTSQNISKLGEVIQATTVFILDMTNAFLAAADGLAQLTSGVLAYEAASAGSKRADLVRRINKARATGDTATENRLTPQMEEMRNYEKNLLEWKGSVENMSNSAKSLRRFVEQARETIAAMDPAQVVNAAGQYSVAPIPGAPTLDQLLPTMPQNFLTNSDTEDTLRQIERHLSEQTASNEMAVFQAMDKSMSEQNTILRKINGNITAHYLKPPVKIEVK
jgi:hypothetical protein